MPAPAAWEPNSGTDPSYWDNNLTGHSFTSAADWVWESYRVVHFIDGDVVNFRQEFVVPGTASGGDLWITVDNGYEAYLNGTFVGTAQVHNYNGTDWQVSPLYQSWIETSGWQSVEHYDISGLLVSGVNTLIIEAANEYMGPADGQSNGTISSNPGGVIFELNYTLEPTDDYVVDFCNSPVASASSNSPVCEGYDIVLTGGPAGMDTYAWEGPDGWTSDQQNPSRSNATPEMSGEYTLTVTSAEGCSASDSTSVTVSEAPVADFTADPTSVCVGYDVYFTDLSTGEPTSWSWDFGDGATSTDQNPSHSYSAAGSYDVSLTVSNDCGDDTATDYVTITVSDAPVADFEADPTSVCVGYDVYFTDLSTGEPTSWSWDFGDGATSASQIPSTPTAPPASTTSPSPSSMTAARTTPPTTSPSP